MPDHCHWTESNYHALLSLPTPKQLLLKLLKHLDPLEHLEWMELLRLLPVFMLSIPLPGPADELSPLVPSHKSTGHSTGVNRPGSTAGLSQAQLQYLLGMPAGSLVETKLSQSLHIKSMVWMLESIPESCPRHHRLAHWRHNTPTVNTAYLRRVVCQKR